jgi:hypothetical protein
MPAVRFGFHVCNLQSSIGNLKSRLCQRLGVAFISRDYQPLPPGVKPDGQL